MKARLIGSFLMLCSFFVQAQAPQKFSFQGVARKADGKVAGNSAVGIRITIHSESPAGAVVYQETHTPQTNGSGIFNISVGGGAVVSGKFEDISWKTFIYFLQLEVDPLGGTGYTDLGSTQMLSVPYALHAGEASRWQDGYPVVQSHQFGPDVDINDPDVLNDPDLQKYKLSPVGDGNRMIWYPFKGAFRAGQSQGNNWDDANIGVNSVAFGSSTMASGDGSASFGINNHANGISSLAGGLGSHAVGQASFAYGTNNLAQVHASSAFGEGVNVNAVAGFAIGRFNGLTTASVDKDVPAPLDPVFQIGNGSQDSDRKNAFTVLRNGSTGIGIHKSMPEYMLDVGGRARIRHSGATAGIHLNGSTNTPTAFMGMVNDHKVGFYIGNDWLFQVADNGNVGIGVNIVDPAYSLDVDGRIGVRHNGNTAGVHFNNSKNEAGGFVGMKTDDQVGFYLGNTWKFWVDNAGNGYINNAIVQTSDRRLKRDFSALSSSLKKITDLTGYHYYWKDNDRDQSIQTGLIAQEVEALFPELVKTDEKGFKSLNYVGLIPHLIESIKELVKQNEQLKAENAVAGHQNQAILDRLSALEAVISKNTANQLAKTR